MLDLGARGLSGCVEGSRRDRKYSRKYPRLAAFQLLTEEQLAEIQFLFIINTTYVIKIFPLFPELYLFLGLFLLHQFGFSVNPDDFSN
jgi:hypothetical protein